MRRHGREDRHGILLRAEAALHVQRRPGTVDLVLRDTVAVLAAMAQATAIEQTRQRANHIPHDQPYGTANGRIGPPSRPKQIIATVDVQFAGDRPIHHREDCRATSTGRWPVIPKARIPQGLDRSDDDRHILGLTARHHRIDRHLLRGDRHLAVLDKGNFRFRLEPCRFEHAPDAVLRRWHHRQPIRPPFGIVQLYGVRHILHFVALRLSAPPSSPLLPLSISLPSSGQCHCGKELAARQGEMHLQLTWWVSAHGKERALLHVCSFSQYIYRAAALDLMERLTSHEWWSYRGGKVYPEYV